MEGRKKLPIGIEHFEKIITQDFYYVDKTRLIKDLLENWGEVNLFTRPRRFGKSLNMSMLKCFFEIGCDKTLFDGLMISGEKELCEKYMGQYPVISISLKGVSGMNFEKARDMLNGIISAEARRHQYLMDSERLSQYDKRLLEALLVKMADTDVLENSLWNLSQLLHKHHGKKVIILIDEYDVPLSKAYDNNYYDQMISLIRNILEQALKTNESLQFAVMTGCLRVSKESIFTGLNNPKILSITDVRFNEYFGFTDEEVRKILSAYGFTEHYDSVKSWYDGYRFGNVDVYCPWDVICYCDTLCAEPDAELEDYWSNTSSNSIVQRFIDKANQQTRDEIEELIAGGTIIKEIRSDLTYNELDKSIDNLWSVLFTTGYLTQRGKIRGNKYRLAIPNLEIRELFVSQIKVWFRESAGKDTPKLDAFCEAFPAADAETVEKQFNDYLLRTISIRDTFSQKVRKENFYHGVLLGLLQHKENWSIRSNAESGEGFSDILIEIPDTRIGVVIEVKYAEQDKLDESCAEALKQIAERKYEVRLIQDGMQNIIKYGIACYRKHCKVVVEKAE